MIKQQKQYNKKCQVFTPQNYVETLLDYIDYNEECFYKSIKEFQKRNRRFGGI